MNNDLSQQQIEVKQELDRLILKSKETAEYTESVRRWLYNYFDGNLSDGIIQTHRKIEEICEYLSSISIKFGTQIDSNSELDRLKSVYNDLIDSKKIMNVEISKSCTHLDMMNILDQYLDIQSQMQNGKITEQDASALFEQLRKVLVERFNSHSELLKENESKMSQDFCQTGVMEQDLILETIKELGIENPESKMKLTEIKPTLEIHEQINKDLEFKNQETDNALSMSKELLEKAQSSIQIDDIQNMQRLMDGLIEVFNVRGRIDYGSANYIIRQMESIISDMQYAQIKAVQSSDIVAVANLCERIKDQNIDFTAKSVQILDTERMNGYQKQINEVLSLDVSNEVSQSVGSIVQTAMSDMLTTERGVSFHSHQAVPQQFQEQYKALRKEILENEKLHYTGTTI